MMMQDSKPGSLENDQQADYNPTARNFDQEDVSGPSKPINNVNQETAEISNDPPGNRPSSKQDAEASDDNESRREANWAPPEEAGRNENNRGEDLPNAPSE